MSVTKSGQVRNNMCVLFLRKVPPKNQTMGNPLILQVPETVSRRAWSHHCSGLRQDSSMVKSGQGFCVESVSRTVSAHNFMFNHGKCHQQNCCIWERGIMEIHTTDKVSVVQWPNRTEEGNGYILGLKPLNNPRSADMCQNVLENRKILLVQPGSIGLNP